MRDDDWEDDLDDAEFPDADDSEDSDASETVPCPHCREPVFEDAEQCPSCGRYLSREDAPKALPVWLVVGAALALTGMLGWLILR